MESKNPGKREDTPTPALTGIDSPLVFTRNGVTARSVIS